MHSVNELDSFSKNISDAVRRREFLELAPIMRNIFLEENKLSVLVGLADRLPSVIFEAFFLCGLSELAGMNDDEYAKLFELSKGKEIAIYHLVRFLMVHGGARAKALQDLGVDLSEMQQVDLFKYLLEGGSLPGEIEKMNGKIYVDYEISKEDIWRFKGKFTAV